jgi:hypothetical protein
MQIAARFSRPSFRSLFLALSVFASFLLAGGCASVAQVTNVSDDACRGSFQNALSSILTAEGEKPEVAEKLVAHAVSILSTGLVGPRPFLVSSPSGTDYELFVQAKKPGCLLRLYARQKGFVRYTNNMTYIQTRPLPACACAE